ncbi:hypothetical protein FACS1894203_4350 [Bacteroidia bacterium]|nr:hypothetical protein FACS1894203_4350 [Bacteroidia bacterium]
MISKYSKKIVPLWSCILYPIFVSADLLTTYFATPDLRYEGNPIICYFQWKWTGILLWNSLIIIGSIFLVFISNKYSMKYLKKEFNNKYLFIVFCLVFICFYAHFVALIYTIPSNYLMYLYLNLKTDTLLYNFALNFVNFAFRKGVSFYLLTLYSMSLLIGILITIYRINHIKQYVQVTFPT